MNTFVLSRDPRLAAKYHCNKHVIKMILESSQMLCAAHWIHLLKSQGKTISSFKRIRDAQTWAYENTSKKLQPPWKMSHMRHPCTVWTSANLSNYSWQLDLCQSLLSEYTLRYKKIHKAEEVAEWLKTNLPINIEKKEMTSFPVCMKDEFKVYDANGIIDVVSSYQRYYIKDKVRFAKWEPKASTPRWFQEGLKNERARPK